MSRSFTCILALFLLLSTLPACSSSEETASADEEDQKDEKKAEKLDEKELKARKHEVKKGDVKKVEKGDTTEKKEEGSGAKSRKEEDHFARHKRTPCYGQCPTYTLTIQANGKAKLKAERFTDLEKGTYKGRVEKEELDKLREKAEEIGFFEMQGEYDNPRVTDLPSRITELSFEGKAHKVKNRHGGPDRLKELEERFARIVEETDWSSSSTE